MIYVGWRDCQGVSNALSTQPTTPRDAAHLLPIPLAQSPSQKKVLEHIKNMKYVLDMTKRNRKARPARPLFYAAPLPATKPVGAGPDSMRAEIAPLDQASPDSAIADPARHDGWTRPRRERFLVVFGECGSAAKAAEAAGLSRQAAYDLRGRDPEFAAAWNAARHVSRQVVIDQAISSAFEGRRVRLYQQGEQVGERLHNSPSMVFSLVKKIRSKAMLGNARVMAASLHFERCLILLGQGIAFPDPENDVEAAPNVSAPAGWTPADQVAFCRALSRCGSVAHACETLGKPRSTAYAARHHADGAAFGVAWDAALFFASELLLDLAMDLTHEGAIEITARRGKLPVKKRVSSPDARAKAGIWLAAILPPLETASVDAQPAQTQPTQTQLPQTRQEQERTLVPTFDRNESGEAQAEIEAADTAQAAEKRAQGGRQTRVA